MNCGIYNGYSYHKGKYICNEDNYKKYQIIIMDVNGKTYSGRIYDSLKEVRKAMIELRILYAKNKVTHHVGYMEVR